MNPFILVSFVTLGLVGIFLQLKREFKIVDFFYLLLFTITSIWASSFYSNSSPVYGLIAIVALNYSASYISIFRKKALKSIVPFLTLILFALYFKDDVIEVLGDSYAFVNMFLILGALISIFAFHITVVKGHVLRKLMVGLSASEVSELVFIMLTGFTTFLGFFAASSFGVLVITAFALSTSFYYAENTRAVSLSLLAMMTLPLLGSLSGITEVNLLGGDVLEGVFFGVFGAYLISKTTRSRNSSVGGVVVAYLVVILFITALLLLELLYSKMGGMDAFIGAIFGISVVALFVEEKHGLGALFAILIAIGSYAPQFMINNELLEFEATTQGEREEKGELKQQDEYLKLSNLTGDFEFIKDSSNVSFVLGAEGETHGAFKSISGTIVLNQDVRKSTLSVRLDLDDFTTFNGFRDGSLMEESYFHQAKYPTLSYTSLSMEKIDAFTYKVSGNFEMLGVLQPVEVTLKWMDINGVNVLVGEGVLDRTLFGMSPSATEGNIVSFNYRVQLNK